MNIEEAKDIIKNEIDDFVIGDYCVEICGQKDKCKDECLYSIAIETVLNELEEIDKAMTLQDKITRLMIKDFQTEGYFNYMKYEQIIEYYKRRKDLKE